MLLRKQVIIGLVFLLLGMAARTTYAQLITDSDARLNTISRKRAGFVANQRKRQIRGTAASQRPGFTPAVAPRSASGISYRTGRLKSTSPRYSQVSTRYSGKSTFRNNRGRNRFSSGPASYYAKSGKKVQPRYSQRSTVVVSNSKPIRYSTGTPFTRKDYKFDRPRYSQPILGQVLTNASAPRYSTGAPFTRKDYKRNVPRYSTPVNKNVIANVNPPRYSPGSPFRPGDYKIEPRYSHGNRDVVSLSRAPRYSTGAPFTNKDLRQREPRYGKPATIGSLAKVDPPRYSPGSPFTRQQMNVKPRYSKPRTDVIALSKAPRYSPSSPFSNKDLKVRPVKTLPAGHPEWRFSPDPRYSPEHPFLGKQKVNPRYTITADYSLKRYWMLRNQPAWGTASTFKGPYNVKLDKKRDMHPSANYLKVAHASSAQVREAYRSWSIVWNRVNGNNVQPGAVTDKVSKPKFDKKEREIWNN